MSTAGLEKPGWVQISWLTVQPYSSTDGPSKECLPHTNYWGVVHCKIYKDKSEDDENADKSENTEETFEDEVNENDMKNENVEESLEPVEVDKAGWRSFRRGDTWFGQSKMFANYHANIMATKNVKHSEIIICGTTKKQKTKWIKQRRYYFI